MGDGGDCCGDSGKNKQYNYCSDCSCLDPTPQTTGGYCTKGCGAGAYVGDGFCDDSNNNCGCDWDEGDCCGSSGKNKQFNYCSDCLCLDPNMQDGCSGGCGASAYVGDGFCDMITTIVGAIGMKETAVVILERTSNLITVTIASVSNLIQRVLAVVARQHMLGMASVMMVIMCVVVIGTRVIAVVTLEKINSLIIVRIVCVWIRMQPSVLARVVQLLTSVMDTVMIIIITVVVIGTRV